MREAPGTDSPVVGEIPPDATGLNTTGERRRVGTSIWREISLGRVHGWVNERFLVEWHPSDEAPPDRRPAQR